jgi:long-chain alkane monooxygenase
MAKKIHLNAFEMNCIGHLSHGLWRYPGNERHRYTDIEYWIELARLLERGLFDAVFLADVVGVYDIYRKSKDTAIREAVQIPNNDPFLVVPVMASVTKHLGFAVTSSTTYEPPFSHARRISTLDHLTKGRIGWNIVTSHLPNAAHNFGLEGMVRHDERYQIADEYLEVCYKLWEGSWEDEAVVRDAENSIYTDPTKVHYINHSGMHFKVAGPHLSEPSSQRSPVLYQAGTSSKGRSFAARHAECVFLEAYTLQDLKHHAEDIRSQAKLYGRRAEDIKMFTGLSVIVGRSREEAQHKYDHFRKLISVDGMLVHYGGASGYDLSAYSPEDYLEHNQTDHIQSSTTRFTKKNAEQKTVGQVIDSLSTLESRGLLAVGTPEEIADQLQYWIEETGLDGFNLRQFVSPGTFYDFIELVIPELQRRGLYREQYEEGTFRERLFGQGVNRLPNRHPGAAYRDLSFSPAFE